MKKVFLKVEEDKLQFFLELIKNLDFVQIQDYEVDSKEEIEANVREGFEELQKYKKGKLKTTSAKDFIDEL
ncbi:hypothetical protein [Aequorivita viscosa]|uniref:Addiction module component n=1 Tax=Aequorivita viscosa TaxID=797419 RepID=A0A1M6LVI3_9FLAO|nr:hypothetical protein [Aequorivita viscosa]SDX25160.1 hypothetical protein SAMN05216556_1225 [Aequorivita viscosa]SHJ75175.1 hypothetical protein SAMN04487908_12454 [Aequorivita viscosa]